MVELHGRASRVYAYVLSMIVLRNQLGHGFLLDVSQNFLDNLVRPLSIKLASMMKKGMDNHVQ